MSKRTLLVIVGAFFALVAVFAISMVSTYNKLVRLDQAVDAQWAQVENVYQRRMDLVPNLVETVKAAASHERETFEAVTQARAKVGQIQIASPENAEQLQRYQAAQGELSSALSRLMMVSENYPTLKANENFLALQAQLEGTENRIAVERMRFNETAREFNTSRDSFPTVLMAGFFGSKFANTPYFEANAGAEVAPQVKF